MPSPRNQMKMHFLLAASLWGISLTAASADIAGQVVGIVDGDTVDVVSADMERHRIRLISIDAPERTQPFGTRSKQALSDMVYGKQVSVVGHGKDMYGRQLGEVMVGTASANKAMVHLGLAWAYRPKLQDSSYLDIESSARQDRRGLWADPKPVAPWTYRREQRQKPSSSTAPN